MTRKSDKPCIERIDELLHFAYLPAQAENIAA
jgi:hypothetical protein